ncbi:MAG: nicotinate-nucleotide adenylyltransferase [Prevotellaceae bacterium]|jgi:nicotinate-nucleotide adenylyltransferase|nr:nicotinate-nucleotide adenylyltransferase [Prevotellaceae bacterium]
MKTGIYSGSFNPLHNGHIALADHLVENNIVDELWLVVSPQNPLKREAELLDDHLRFEMAEIAFKDRQKIKISDVEFALPKPNYTIDTLNFLQQKYPENQFVLLIGADNAAVFDKWKNYSEILKNYSVMVYPRLNYPHNSEKYPQMQFISAPLLDVSSTEIRKRISQGLPCEDFLPRGVLNFIKGNNLFVDN